MAAESPLAEFGLSADGSFSNGSKATYTYGTAVAHVAVDPATGHVEVLDYCVVDDVGRVINPLTLHGQVVGAAVQGLGSVFSEEILYDKEGQLLVGSLADYMISGFNRLSACPRYFARALPLAQQSAGRQGRRRRRHHPRGRCSGECGLCGAELARRKGARAATHAATHLESHPGGRRVAVARGSICGLA